MLKRGMSIALTTLLVGALTFVSFGDTIKKNMSDDEVADSIKIEQPTAKIIKADTLAISGTATSGVGLSMTLVRLDGKPAIDSADTLKWPKVPSSLISNNFESEREKNIVKKFEKAYSERVSAGITFEAALASFEKGKKDKLSAAKLKDLKEALDKAEKNLNEALSAYYDAADSFSTIMKTTIFEDASVNNKLAAFSKTVKDMAPGFYQLSFKRTDLDRVVKVYYFEIQTTSDLKNQDMLPVIPADSTGK